MTNFQIKQGLAAMRDAALDDLAAMSDDDLQKEAIEDGIDVESLAAHLRESMTQSAAAALRARMSESKVRHRAATQIALPALGRPSVARIKELIKNLTQRDPRVGFAFRDGKSQSDEDWKTAYDDLVAMGALPPEDDGD